MTPAEHYAKAESLAIDAFCYLTQDVDDVRTVKVAAIAQVHATLALAANTTTAPEDFVHIDASIDATGRQRIKDVVQEVLAAQVRLARLAKLRAAGDTGPTDQRYSRGEAL